MIRPVRPTEPGSPQGRSKHHHGQEEKHARDLKPQNPAHPAERAYKASHALSESTRSLAGHLACRPPRWLILGARWPILGDCPILRCARECRRGGLAASGSGNALAGHASGDAESDAESTANGLRLHFDLMVTAPLRQRFWGLVHGCRLLSGGVRSKVEES
jgi:hypothetical protein